MKDETYYINKCSSDNAIGGRDYTKYGYSKSYLVEDKHITLHFNQYSNGADDYDDELTSVEIKPVKSLLDNLKDAVNMNPMQLLGKN